MRNILVGQSGGPTAAINASLYGVIQEGKAHPEQVGLKGFCRAGIWILRRSFPRRSWSF